MRIPGRRIIALGTAVSSGALLIGVMTQASASGNGQGRRADQTARHSAPELREAKAVRNLEAIVQRSSHLRRHDVPAPGTVEVGPLQPPASSCPLQLTSADRVSVDGAPTARLAGPPANLDQWVKALLSPCVSSARSPIAPNTPEPPIWFKVDGMVSYGGDAGTVSIVTATPSPQALADGIALGSPDGSLADGTPLWSQFSVGDSTSQWVVLWQTQGVIVQMSSADLTRAQLTSLASAVVVK